MHSLLCLLHFLLCLLHLQQFKPQTNVTKRRRAELNPREVHVRLSRSIRGRKTKTPHSPAFAPCALWLRARSAGYGRHHPRMCACVAGGRPAHRAPTGNAGALRHGLCTEFARSVRGKGMAQFQRRAASANALHSCQRHYASNATSKIPGKLEVGSRLNAVETTLSANFVC